MPYRHDTNNTCNTVNNVYRCSIRSHMDSYKHRLNTFVQIRSDGKIEFGTLLVLELRI